MAKLQIEANELVGANVDFVSMVKKGAIRIPFRITKEDNSMIDLTKIGNDLFKKADADKKPGILAAIVNKGDDFEAVKKHLADAGIDVTAPEEKDGVVVFKQKGVDDVDCGTVKIGDNLALVVSGLKKAFTGYDFNSTMFAEVLATGGYYPSVYTATDMLNCTVQNILAKAESPEMAVTEIGAAVDAFKGFITALTKGLPVQAFKADGYKVPKPTVADADLKKAVTIDPTKDQSVGDEPGKSGNLAADGGAKVVDDRTVAISINIGKADAPELVDLTVAEVKAIKADGAPTPDELKAAAKKKKPAASDSESMADAAMQKTDFAELTKAISASLAAGLSDISKAVGDQVKAIQTEVGSLKKTVDETTAKVKKTEAAVSGTVIVDTKEDRAEMLKSDQERRFSKAAPPLLDTAFTKAA